MGFLKQLFNFYVNASIHVAFAVVSLMIITYIEYNLKLSKTLLLFVFFATITGYNFVKYFGLAKFHHRSLTSSLKIIQIFSLFCFLGLCYYLFFLSLNTIIALGVCGLITFFYAIPFLPKSMLFDKTHNLRQISGLKIYVIALIWAVVIVLIPLIYSEFVLSHNFWITFIQRFLFVLVLMIPFEIRDMNFDSLKLATLPQKIGVKKTKIIGVFFLLIFIILECFKSEFNQKYFIIYITIALLTLCFILLAKQKQSSYYSSFWVESLPMVWYLLYII